MEEITILGQLVDKRSSFQTIFNNRVFREGMLPKDTMAIVGNSYQIPLQQTNAQLLDTYEVEHGLTDPQLRILFKILAKDYEDCGRKRGAILRYISHYENVDQPLGDKRLFAALQSMDTKQ